VLTALSGVALWGLGGWNAVQAVRYPFELEAREGTNWLLGLAHSAGQDLDDHTQVAFVNMNHGPLDPILKGWIHDFLPAAPGHVANRIFVLTLPVAIAWLGVALLRDRPWLGLLLSGALYCVLLGLGDRVLLVGRSDPLAMTLMAGQLIATTHSWRATRRPDLAAAAVGLLAGATFLANWRFAPVTAAALVVWLVRPPGQPRASSLRRELLVAAAAALGVVLLVFGLELHGNATRAYQHFFLFFRRSSGWGASVATTLHTVIGDIWHASRGALVLSAVAGAYCAARAYAARSPVLWWLAAALAATAITAYGLYRNTSGGGLIYMAPAYLFLWFVLVAALRELPLRVPYWEPALLVVLALLIPWRAEERQGRQFDRDMPKAQQAARQLEPILQHRPVYTEDLHLFRRRYSGQVIDMGDAAEVIAVVGSYGRAFTATAARALAGLQAHPPEYVFSGGTQSSVLRRLLADRYEPLLTTPAANPGTLFRLRPGTEDAGTAQLAPGQRPRLVRGRGQRFLSARAPDAATAQAWCRRAQQGAYSPPVARGTFVQFLLPHSNGQDYTCPVP
jgi:hypothetical protein